MKYVFTIRNIRELFNEQTHICPQIYAPDNDIFCQTLYKINRIIPKCRRSASTVTDYSRPAAPAVTPHNPPALNTLTIPALTIPVQHPHRTATHTLIDPPAPPQMLPTLPVPPHTTPASAGGDRIHIYNYSLCKKIETNRKHAAWRGSGSQHTIGYRNRMPREIYGITGDGDV